MAVKVFPGPETAWVSAIVAAPQVSNGGIVYVPLNVEASVRLAAPDIFTWRIFDVLHESPTRFTPGG